MTNDPASAAALTPQNIYDDTTFFEGEGLQLFDTLQVMGVPSKMLYFPDEGHWVQKPQNSQLWYKTVNDWVDQWIGDNATGNKAIGDKK